MNKLVTLLCTSILTIAVSTGPVAAQGDPLQNTQVQTEDVLNNCFVQSIAAFPNRVHIHCMAFPTTGPLSSGAVRYFATENSVATNAMALTILSVANAAIQRNRTLTITYRNSPNQNPAGCNPSDCRRILGVVLN
jgi:hypothetical protein